MTWNRSYQIRFLGTSDPLGEPFTVLPLGDVVAHNTLHIVRQFGGGDLVPSQFTAESRIKPETAAEMDLETLDLLAFGVGDDLPLKTDVRGLYTRARIGTTVEVNADRVIEIVIEIGQSSLQFRDESFGPPLGLDNGEFAEFDARASHDTATPRCGSGARPASASSVRSLSTSDSGTSSTINFCCGVKRTRVEPARSAALATAVSIDPEARPATGAAPT